MAVSTTIGAYQITLVSAQCIGGNQTFVYKVERLTTGGPPPPPGISNVALALCAPDIHHVIDFDPPEPVGDVNTTVPPCFNQPGIPVPKPPQEIKFNISDADLDAGPFIFTFTLAGCFVVGDIDLALHAGNSGGDVDGCTFRKIFGPTCEPLPPEIRGIKISDSKDFIEL